MAKQPIKPQDLKGRMTLHMDFDDSYHSTYRDDEHGVTMSVVSQRRSNKVTKQESQRVYTLDGHDGVFHTAQEVVDAYNKKHFPQS